MKEEKKIMLKNGQRQQLIAPKGIDVVIVVTEPTGPSCTSRNVCDSSNGSIGSGEDILF
jgi:hypothetical protein